MKKLFAILFLVPFFAHSMDTAMSSAGALISSEAQIFAKELANEAVGVAVGATGEMMRDENNELILDACIEGSSALASGPEYLFEMLGDRIGIPLNPARYSVNVRRHFFRCVCQHPEVVATALATKNPFPVILACGHALGNGFIVELRQFVRDLTELFYLSKKTPAVTPSYDFDDPAFVLTNDDLNQLGQTEGYEGEEIYFDDDNTGDDLFVFDDVD